ncbi:MAG TPA: NmrA family NAD(P)-binding protein [Steroidobacteraceae bacterium]|nr:NmrA family NAD(P)-binding protein [Steroidobacteraceae bacterium]
MKQRVAVFAASGRIGQAQVRQLLRHGYPTVAVTRHPVIFDRPEFAGLRIEPADYDDRTSLDRVLASVDSVFFQLPSFGSLAQTDQHARNMCEAALAARVSKFVFNATMWAPDAAPCGVSLYDHVREIEDMLMASGLPAVSFRPVLFMDNLLTLFCKPSIVEEGVYRYCHRPGLEANWISMDDVARFMIQALERPNLLGGRFTIGGPERLRIEEVLAILAEVVGRPITLEYLPARQFGEYIYDRLGPALGPDRQGFADFFDTFYTFNNYAPQRPFEVDVESLLQVMPMELTSLREWARAQDWTESGRDAIGSVVG